MCARMRGMERLQRRLPRVGERRRSDTATRRDGTNNHVARLAIYPFLAGLERFLMFRRGGKREKPTSNRARFEFPTVLQRLHQR